MYQSNKRSAPKRASVSRRSLVGSGFNSTTGPRSRSAERNVPEPDDQATANNNLSNLNNNNNNNNDINQTHFRCDSDPLDAAGDDRSEHGTATIPNSSADGTGLDIRPSTSMVPLPTLPRYPMAETQNRNCWSEPPHANFNIRDENYLREKRPSKTPSGPYLFRAIGADLILTNANSGPTTSIAANYSTILGGQVRSAPTFIINFVCPWGLIVNYYKIPEFYLPYLRANDDEANANDDGARPESLHASVKRLEPHERAMARFLMGSDEERDSTLKLVPIAVEGPLVVRRMVQGKPAIIGKRLPTKYTYYPKDASRGLAECFEVDLMVTETDAVGRTACNMTRRYTSSVTVDLGFVIEGSTEDELPEQMLGCVRLHRIDALMAPTLPGI